LFNENDVTFEHFKQYGLDEKIIMAMSEKNWKYPSGIQLKAIPDILQTTKNMVVQSQSGTGKTGCFAVALLSSIDENLHKPQAILLSPTNELSQQNYHVVTALNRHINRKVFPLRPGRDVDNTPGKNMQILISTPGILVQLLRKKKISLAEVKCFILDEADEMIEGDGNSDQMYTQLKKIKDELKRARKGKELRTLLFSATFKEEGKEDKTSEKEMKMNDFVAKFVDPPYNTYLIPKQKLTLDNMSQYHAVCQGMGGKIDFVSSIYDSLNVGQSMIFVNTKRAGQNVANALERRGLTISYLSSDLTKEERRDVFEEFVRGNSKVLLSTNVLSRGIDVRAVTHVINFDVPLLHPHNENIADTANYLHRVGRTARFGTKGIAINLVGSQKEMNALKQIEKHFKIKIENITLDQLEEEDEED